VVKLILIVWSELRIQIPPKKTTYAAVIESILFNDQNNKNTCRFLFVNWNLHKHEHYGY